VSQVNLLPPEVLQGIQTRRTTVLVIAAGCVVLALIFVFYVVQAAALSGVREDIEAQEATNASIAQEIQSLQRFEELQVQAQRQQQLLRAAFANEVSFSGLLMDLSRVIPSDAYLLSLGVELGAAAPTEGDQTETGAPAGFVGTLAANGQASSIESVSAWLTRLEQIEGWANPWVTSVASTGEGTPGVTFSTGVDLTSDVVTERGRGGIPDEG
jgi:Tfp pilus assembly protein PilN